MDKCCGTCKHRGQEPLKHRSYQGGNTTFYECKLVSHDKNWEYKPGERVVVVDGSGYHAALCVENSFGCVLWESK